MLPKFEEFIKNKLPNNSYIDHDEFDSLFLRKGNIRVNVNGTLYECSNVITIAVIESTKPGTGAFKRFAQSLIEKNYAIYVECVQNGTFAKGLEKHGFTRVNLHHDELSRYYLFNFEGHLKKVNLPKHFVSS
jgi:hypothetical protein